MLGNIKLDLRDEEILVVDDEPTSLKLLTDILVDAGYKVRPANSAQLALRSIAKKTPSLFILDVRMPDINGYELCRLLSENPATKTIPVIFVSAANEPYNRIDGFAAGAVDYIVKPYYTEEVLARVKTHLSLYKLQVMLEESNLLLEEKIFERTMDLRNTNALLNKELFEHKRAEEAKTESELRYKELFVSMQEGFYLGELIFDEAGVPYDWKFVDVNPAHEKIIGIKREDIIGKTILELFPTLEKEWLDTTIKVALTGEPMRMEGFVQATGRYYENFYYSPRKNHVASLFIDTTTKKLAEEALKESEIKLRNILDNSRDAIGVSKSGIHYYANPSYLRLFGYEEEKEIIGKSILDLIAPSDRELIIANIKKREEKEEVPSFYLTRGIKKDKTEFDMEVSVSIYQINSEAYTQVIIRDITEKKKIENALVASEQTARALMDAIQESAMLIELDGTILAANETVAFRLNQTKKRMIGKNVFELVDSKVAENRRIQLNKSIQTEKPVYFTDERFGRTISNTVYPVKDEFGKLTRAAILGFDITDKVKAEKSLKTSEERFKRMFQNSASGMVLVAPNFRFIQVNAAFCSMLGYAENELMEKTFQDVTYSEDLEIGKTNVEQLLAGKIPKIDFEKRYVHKNGNIVWARVSGTLVRDADDSPYNLVTQIIDITENKNAERALRESRAQLETALASMTDAVIISDTSGNLIHINEAFAKFHKFKKKKECAKTFAEYPDILEVYFENGELAPIDMWAIPRALRGETATNTLYSFRRKDTGESWVGSFSFSPIHDAKGTIVGSVVVGRDISEQMKVVEALKLSDQRYNALIQTTNDGFWVVDSEGNILEVNDSYCKMSGYTKEQLLGMKISNLEFIETEVETKTRISGILAKGWDRFESKHRHANGNLIDVDVSTFFLKEQNRILAFFNDTTKRKRAELALKQNHEMMKRLTDQVPGVVYQYRLYPDGRSCFPYSSVGMYNIYECTSEEVREDATPVFGRLHPEDYDMVAGLIAESARTLELFHCEFRVILPQQGLRWRISNARPERMPDGGTLWYGIISDFTDYKLAEAELEIHRNKLEELVLERTKELNSANEELSKKVVRESEFKMMLQQSLEKEKELSEIKSRFISTTSHEFRTPLTSVLSSAELIQRYMGRWDDAKKNEHLERIKNSVSYLTKLLDDVLTISRTETGKIIFNPDQIQLEEFASECIKDASNLSTNHFVSLNYLSDRVTFTLDPKLMKFILNNLLSNAIKYSPDGGKIEVVISNPNSNLIMEVKDEGIGIPEIEVDKVFDSFYRTKNAGNIAGTGLGLAIVKRAVELHNGVISVKSKLNEGTSFTVKIPINENEM